MVPLLSGLGTMASSNSRYLGSALLQGLGGAANSYENVQNQQAQRGLTGAQTNVENTSAAAAIAGIDRDSIYTRGGRDFIMLANGSPMLLGQYLAMPANSRPAAMAGPQAAAAVNKLSGGNTQTQTVGGPSSAPVPLNNIPAPVAPAAPAPPPTPTQAMAGKYNYVGNAGANMADRDFSELINAPEPKRNEQLALSTKVEDSINTNAQAARQQGSTLNQLASQLLAVPSSGPVTGGPLHNLQMAFIPQVNQIADSLGHPEWRIDSGDVATSLSADKLSHLLQFAQARGAGEGIGVLETASTIVPSTSIPKDAAVKILSGMYVDKQKNIDPQNYLNEYKGISAAKGMPDMYRAQSAQAAFAADHNDAQYGAEKDAMGKLLGASYKGEPLIRAMYEGKVNPQFVDKFIGVPHLSRYVLNN
jgi:hypothetical protein